MNQPSSPAQKALAFLIRMVENHTWPDGERLPAIKTLARMAHTSYSAMSTAVNTCKERGLLTVHQRSGIIAGGEAAPQNRSTGGYGLRWMRLRQRIEQDILAGTYSGESGLPACADLSKKYGASINTLKKALAALCHDNLLEPDRTRWRVAKNSRYHLHTNIAFIAQGVNNETIHIIDNRMFQFIETLERRCAAEQIGLRNIPCLPNEPLALTTATSSMFFGYIIWTEGLSATTVEAVISAVTAHHRPVAVIDLGATLRLPARYADNRSIRIFTPATRLAGHCVGNHLLGLGHHGAIFLSSKPHERAPWLLERRGGCVDAFTAAGCGNAVTDEIVDIPSAFDPLPDNPAAKAAINGRLNKALGTLEAAIAEGNRAYRLIPEQHLPHLGRSISVMRELIVNTHTEFMLQPIIRRITERKNSSAIIAANDILAITAINCLKNIGYAVPGDFSVVGFDNYVHSAYQNALTSYDFDFAKMAFTAVSFLINPGLRSFQSGQTQTIQGFIVERDSTGRCHGPHIKMLVTTRSGFQ